MSDEDRALVDQFIPATRADITALQASLAALVERVAKLEAGQSDLRRCAIEQMRVIVDENGAAEALASRIVVLERSLEYLRRVGVVTTPKTEPPF